MSDMWSNCFSFVLVTFRLPVFQNCLEIGLFRKNQNREGLRIWNFQGYQRNSMWNFQGLIKNEVEFPRVTKKNNVEFPGIFVFGLGTSKISNRILWNIQGLSFVLSRISTGKAIKWEIPGVFSKKYILNLPLNGFFSGIAPLFICCSVNVKELLVSYVTPGSFLLFIDNYCWPDMLFHGQGGRVIGQINI